MTKTNRRATDDHSTPSAPSAVPDGPTAHASRDKAKDIPVIINDVVVAIVYGGSDHPVVVWQVYGPQDLDRAYEICKQVKRTIEKITGIVPEQPTATAHTDGHRPAGRPASKVFRELLAKGLDDDAVWAAAKEELGLPDSAKYRVKEYRREMEKAGQLATPVTGIQGDPLPPDAKV